MIRAKFKQKWRGDWYDKGQVIPANDMQRTRLLDAKIAYVSNDEFPAMDKLRSAGYNDIKSVKQASDDQLLEVDGIGTVTLKKIRTYTNEVEGCGCG